MINNQRVFPGGKVDAMESIVETVLREIKEETGIYIEMENEEKGIVIEDLEGEALKNEIECPKYAVFYSYESEYFVHI